MPLYEYACDECGAHFEARRSWEEADDVLPCPECDSLLTQRALSVPAFLRGAGNSAPAQTSAPPKKNHAVGCYCCR
ncbi:MAG: zinc ribbon domain-containing protein [Chloroflexi bacterium]|uniref:FmdB family zinc ribbon protein n=1 Tax=Candidatus Flexifilum breve TaxID=3140694 RepID=UPI003134B6A4|nr:zinc ribbon domain-containing protein [Chloroflexota bacterium]